jgi:hypothetical protein
MAVGHDQAPAADARDFAGLGPEVDRRELAQHRLVAHFDVGDVAGLILQVLRLHAHARERKDLAPFAERRVPADVRVRLHHRARADLHVGADNRIRPHFHIGVQLRLRVHNRRRMNRRHLQTSI